MAKAQVVRIYDVVFVGPLMMWAGATLASRYKVAGPVLAGLGLLTVAYNGGNYLKERRRA